MGMMGMMRWLRQPLGCCRRALSSSPKMRSTRFARSDGSPFNLAGRGCAAAIYIDNLFKAACILHNMLMHDDGWAKRHESADFWSNMSTGLASPSDFEADDYERLGPDPVRIDYSALARTVPLAEVETVEEREDGYFGLRAALATNFAWLMSKDHVSWLR